MAQFWNLRQTIGTECTETATWRLLCECVDRREGGTFWSLKTKINYLEFRLWELEQSPSKLRCLLWRWRIEWMPKSWERINIAQCFSRVRHYFSRMKWINKQVEQKQNTINMLNKASFHSDWNNLCAERLRNIRRVVNWLSGMHHRRQQRWLPRMRTIKSNQ